MKNTNEEYLNEYLNLNDKPYYVFKYLFYPIAILFYRPKFINKRKLNKNEAYIFACNHLNAKDPAFICMGTNRVVHFLAKKELFSGFKKYFFKLSRCIPVDRSKKNDEVMEISKKLLKKNKTLGIFVEGTRNKTNNVLSLPLKFGAVALSCQLQVKIIPIYLSYQKGFHKVIINYGEEYIVAENEDLEKANQELANKLIMLQGENLCDIK